MHQGRDAEAGPNSQLRHGRQEAACLADLLCRHDVRNDACVGGLGGVEEELDDREADEDLDVVVSHHEDHQARHRDQRTGHDDGSPASEARVDSVGPGAHDGRNGHREDSADPKRHSNGCVL